MDLLPLREGAVMRISSLINSQNSHMHKHPAAGYQFQWSLPTGLEAWKLLVCSLTLGEIYSDWSAPPPRVLDVHGRGELTREETNLLRARELILKVSRYHGLCYSTRRGERLARREDR